ncbi:hypothetical protein D3C71_1500440 [compost metagenome]
MVAVRQPQMVREGGPVQLVAVKGLIQRAFQADLRVVRLVGVHVQVARSPGAGFDGLGVHGRGGLGDDRGRGFDDGFIVVIVTAAGAQQGDASQGQGHDGPAQAGYFELHGHTPTSGGVRRHGRKGRNYAGGG